MSKERDLLNEYPDLSDDEDNNLEGERGREQHPLPNSQPHKIVKPNEPTEPQRNSSFVAPKIFGGRNFTPPPPPPPASANNRRQGYAPPPPTSFPPPPAHYNQSRPNLTPPRPASNDPQGARVERERKNCIFVKNIPKFYNEMEKLMTYFKNEGPVKDIKINLEESSAMVRFVREESAIRFINSKKAVLNRECIVCSFNEKEVVPQEMVQKREDEETGKVKKLELDEKMLRERSDFLLADTIRGMLFASKYVT